MTKEPGKFGCKKYDKINEHDDDEDWHSDASWSVLKRIPELYFYSNCFYRAHLGFANRTALDNC